MRTLLKYELRKIWYGKRKLLAMLLLAALVLPIVLSSQYRGFWFTPENRKLNEETRPYWGKTVDKEALRFFLEKAESCGAGVIVDPIFPEMSMIDVRMDVEEGLEERFFWASLFDQPKQSDQEESLLSMKYSLEEDYQAGKIQDAAYHHQFRRYKDPAVWQIAPKVSAWRQFLNPIGYGPLLAGVLLLAFLVILLSDSYTLEKNAGLGEISHTGAKSRMWVCTKCLACALSGAIAAGIFYGALLLFYGILYGFQGFNVGALSATGLGGYVYGEMYAEISCLGLSLLLIVFRMAAGAFLGLLIAFFSSICSRSGMAAGLSILSFLVMTAGQYAEGIFMARPTSLHWLNVWDFGWIHALDLTPIRLFLNPETLTMSLETLPSAFDVMTLYNVLIVPELCLGFVGLMLLVSAPIVWYLCKKA